MIITKDMLGMRVRIKGWPKDEYVEVLHVGTNSFFWRYDSGAGTKEGMYNCERVYGDSWEFYEEPEKTRLMAPAMCVSSSGAAFISDLLFESEEAARKYHYSSFLKWPATPNKDGFYEVP